MNLLGAILSLVLALLITVVGIGVGIKIGEESVAPTPTPTPCIHMEGYVMTSDGRSVGGGIWTCTPTPVPTPAPTIVMYPIVMSPFIVEGRVVYITADALQELMERTKKRGGKQ